MHISMVPNWYSTTDGHHYHYYSFILLFLKTESILFTYQYPQPNTGLCLHAEIHLYYNMDRLTENSYVNSQNGDSQLWLHIRITQGAS